MKQPMKVTKKNRVKKAVETIEKKETETVREEPKKVEQPPTVENLLLKVKELELTIRNMKRIKNKKDPDYVKRKPNKWALFVGEEYRKMKADDPELKLSDVMKNVDVKRRFKENT